MKKGFTLVELLTVSLIIGVLAAVAIPAYNQYIIRTSDQVCEHTAATVVRVITSHLIEFGNIADDYGDISRLNSILGQNRFTLPYGYELYFEISANSTGGKDITVIVYDRQYMGMHAINV